jgi:hypothetical protein
MDHWFLEKTTAKAPKYDPLLSRQKVVATPRLSFFVTAASTLIFGIACGGGIHLARFSSRFQMGAEAARLTVDLSWSRYEFMKPWVDKGILKLSSRTALHLAVHIIQPRELHMRYCTNQSENPVLSTWLPHIIHMFNHLLIGECPYTQSHVTF